MEPYEFMDERRLRSFQADLDEPELQEAYLERRLIWKASGPMPDATLLELRVQQRRRAAEPSLPASEEKVEPIRNRGKKVGAA